MHDPRSDGSHATARALLEHRAFLLRVAGELCGWRLAEDVVQEASLRALQHPARHDASLRAWLAAIVRNTSYEMLRADARRRRREAQAAREASSASGGELRDEDALHQAVREALERIREPYRTVLVSRIVEDLSPPQIAHRQGAPLETVRAQLRRGRELLRAELDRRGGGRREWTVALVAALGMRAPAPSGPLRPRWLPVGASVAGTAAVLGAIWLSLGGRLEEVDTVGFEVARLAGPRNDPGLSSPPGTGPDTARVPASPATIESARVSGRVVDPSGRPVSDARVHALPALEEVLSVPLERAALSSADVGADGSFELGLPSSPVLLVASAPDSVAHEVLRVDAPPRQPVELELEPAEPLRGRVVDTLGLPVAGAAVELFKREAYPGLRHRSGGDGSAFLADLPSRTTTDSEGRFELLRRASGPSTLFARHAGSGEAVLALAMRPLGDVELVLGARASAELEVELAKGPLEGIRVELFGTSGDGTLVDWTDAEGRCRFDDLPSWRSFVAVLTRDDLATTVSLPRGFHQDGRWVMRVARPRVLAVSVLGADDRPVGGARVLAVSPLVVERTRAAGFPSAVAERVATVCDGRTDERGTLRVPRWGNEPVLLEVESEDGSRTTTAYVRSGLSEFTIRLPVADAPARIVSLRAVGGDGLPLRAVRVRSLAFEGPTPSAGAWKELAAEDGRFAWSEPGGRAFVLEVEAPGHVRRRTQLEPGGDAAPEVELVLQRERTVALRLVDARGRGLVRALVLVGADTDSPVLVASRPGVRQTRFFVDREGRAVVRGLPDESVTLEVPIAGFDEPFRLELDRLELPGERELRLPVVVPRATRLQRVELELPVDHRLVRMRARTTGGEAVLDRTFRWKDGSFSALDPGPLRFLVEEDGRMPRQVADLDPPPVGRDHACGLADARRAFVDLELPAEELVTLSIEAAGRVDERLLAPADSGPIVFRVAERSR